MNIVHVRDLVKRMARAKVFSDQIFKKLIYAPVFIYDYTSVTWTEEEIAWVKENVMDSDHHIVPVNLPYKDFILYQPNGRGYGSGGTEATVFIIYSTPHSILTKDSKEAVPALLTAVSADVLDGNECWMKCSYTGYKEKGIIVSMWCDGETVEIPRNKIASDQEFNELLKVTARSPRNIITRLAFDVMSNTSAVIKVEPKSTGRSVEWQLARTHYCILGKKQAMTMRDSRRAITPHDLKRAAHWRRAHFRTLRAEKWTHKKGHRVPVCEAWIGPTEWIGLEDKIYKLQPPVKKL